MNQQQQLDLLLVVVYLIAVAYVFYVALSTEEQRTTLKYDRADLDAVLDRENLKGKIDIDFKLEKRYEFDKPKDLGITINNKFESVTIEVDWDRSLLIDIGGRSRRLIRLTPDKRLDLSDRQVFSIIAAGKSLRETITAEDLLNFNADKGAYEASKPIVDIGGLEKAAKAKDAKDAQKKQYADFMASKISLKFSVYIAVRLYDLLREIEGSHPYVVHGEAIGDRPYLLLPCTFEMKRVPWPQSLPWNAKG